MLSTPGAAFDRGAILPCIFISERRRALVTGFFGAGFRHFFLQVRCSSWQRAAAAVVVATIRRPHLQLTIHLS